MTKEDKEFLRSLIQPLYDRMGRLEARFGRLEDRMTTVEESLKLLNYKMVSLEDRVSGVEGRLSGVEQKVELFSVRLDALARSLAEFRRETKKHFANLDKRVRHLERSA